MKALNAEKPTRIRFSILAAIFISVVINYMDRSNISIAATAINNDLHLSTIQLGYIFSAFGWTYSLLQIPGGLMADKFGPRIIYACCLVVWSLVTIVQGIAVNFIMLFILRLLIGVFEAPSYPINNRIVTTWFPENERASAIAVYTSGQFIGLAFLAPVLTALQYYTGWRGLFIITGVIGIIWGIVWYLFYRQPKEHSKINDAELKHIEAGGGLVNVTTDSSSSKQTFSLRNLKEVFSHKKLWGIYLGQFALGATLWFFLTWFPTYLVQYKHLDFIKSGFLASAPFLAAFSGILFSGFLSDYMMRKKVPAAIARKTPVITGLLLTVTIIGANYTNEPFWIMFFMCIAFFGNGLASITWVFVSTLAPAHLVGVTGGVFNFIGNLSAVFVPIVIGYLTKDGSFTSALIFIAALGIAGALCYIFLVGKVERIEVNKFQ